MGDVNSSRPDGDRPPDLVVKGKRPGLWITVTQSTNNGPPEVLGTYQVPWEKRAIPATKVIKRAPGCWILKAADFLCSPPTVENVYEAAVADLRHEYCEALQEGRPWKARVLIWQYLFSGLILPFNSSGFSLMSSSPGKSTAVITTAGGVSG